jgi:RNA polymerase sigma-70 factor, ECF subfamily
MSTAERGRLPLQTNAGALLSDLELVERVLAGDTDWYGILIQRHQDALHRVAYSMVLDSDAAADLTQDAFIRAFANLRSCREPQRFGVWLMTLLRNRCLDWLKERRRRDLPLEDEAARVPAGGDTLHRLADRSVLQRALGVLPVTLRDAFLLRHVEELSYDDMADVLGTSPGAAKMRVSRAREALREQLKADAREAAHDVTPVHAGSSDD